MANIDPALVRKTDKLRKQGHLGHVPAVTREGAANLAPQSTTALDQHSRHILGGVASEWEYMFQDMMLTSEVQMTHLGLAEGQT